MPNDDRRDVLTRLLDCHARIREMLGLARRLGSDLDTEEAIVEAASDVRRYFRRALLMHTRDEDESIAPRLRSAGGEVAAALERMQREHAEHEPHIAGLIDACEALREQPFRTDELRAPLLAHLDPLDRELRAHLDEEERAIFPHLNSALDDATRELILREMEERREASGGGGGGGGRGRNRR
jgi:hemerythrin-like domain-containing protein